MTNAEIIFRNRVALFKEGIIGGSGIMVATADGGAVEMPEEIHTFNGWHELGFGVKKGEHSVARFPIWKRAKGKAGQDADGGDAGDTTDAEEKRDGFFLKTAFFFTRAQVEPLKVN